MSDIAGQFENPSLLLAEVWRMTREYEIDPEPEKCISPDAVVDAPDSSDYRVPSYLAKTAPDLAAQFGELLDGLRALNERFVGGNVYEAMAFLSLTGEHESLEEGFLAWTETYFSRRVEACRRVPQLMNDTLSLLHKVDTEFNKLAAKLDRQIATLEDKLSREERELRQDEAELAQRKVEAMGTHAENILGLFVGSRSTRKLSSSLTKHRQTEQAKADVEESVEAIAQFKQQLADLDKERLRLAEEINARWGNVVNESTEITVNPKKTDIFVNLFGVAWLPFYSVQAGGTLFEIPAFGVQ